MRSISGIILMFLILFFVSCGPSQEDRARVKLNQARIFLQNQDTSQAILELDSISVLFPKAVYSINAAKTLKDEINWDILQRYELELDSAKIIIEKFEKSFNQEKTEFDRYTQYIHKRQIFDNRWNKSFLKVHLDERGEIYFSSNYYGDQWINHTGIRVYDNPDQAKTERVEAGDANNHRSDFMDGKWEKVTFMDGNENDIIEFIANNTSRRLKAVFLGERYYYIILEEYDKRAFFEADSLSKAIKKQQFLEKEIIRLQAALNIDS
ncbi:MAG: hypothetical protein HQ541_04115 [Mariniphaga sp.]|nr:hypothetical protein [Mariniphaga sp.]